MRTGLKGMLLFILFQAVAYSQDTTGSSSILNRLSISFTTSYNYAPWKKLNDVMGGVQSLVDYDPAFQNANGTYEKVLGDVSLCGSVNFRFTHGLSAVLSGSYLQTGSRLNLAATLGTGPPFTARQLIRLWVPALGGGLRYEHGFSRRFSLVFTALAEYAFGRMQFEYEDRDQYYDEIYSADLSRNVWSGQLMAGVKFSIYGNLSLVGSLGYRFLRFRGFDGSGSYTLTYFNTNQPNYVSSGNYPAHLVEAGQYFGVCYNVETAYGQMNYYTPYYPWMTIATNWDVDMIHQWASPASIDLSGFGGNIGLEFEF